MIQAAIFDVDGTLLDSLSMWEKIDQQYLSSLGCQASEEISRQLFTYSLEEGARFIKETFHLSKSVETIVAQLVALANDYYLHDVPVKKGVKKVLNTFYQQGLPMAICTSNHKDVIDQILKAHQMERYFRYVTTVDEVGQGKESPQIYLTACDHLHATPSHTLVFEDALHAIETLSKTDFITVGCYDDYSRKDQPEIKQLSTYYVHEIDEILPCLETGAVVD